MPSYLILHLNACGCRHLPIATGIMVSSVGFGILILSPLSFTLLRLLGWRQTLVVLSTMCALATFCTVSFNKKRQAINPNIASNMTTKSNDTVAIVKRMWSNRHFLLFLLASGCVEFGCSIPFVFLVKSFQKK